MGRGGDNIFKPMLVAGAVGVRGVRSMSQVVRSISAPAMLRHFRPRTPRRPLAGLRLSQRVAASRDIATRNRKIAA